MHRLIVSLFAVKNIVRFVILFVAVAIVWFLFRYFRHHQPTEVPCIKSHSAPRTLRPIQNVAARVCCCSIHPRLCVAIVSPNSTLELIRSCRAGG